MGKTENFRDEIFTTHTGDGVFNIYPIRSLRTKRYKYIRNLLPDYYHTNHSDLLRKDGAGAYWDSWYKSSKQNIKSKNVILNYHIRPKEEFYDLLIDPNEQNNLITSKSLTKEIRKLREKLDQWMEKQKDQEIVIYSPYPIIEELPHKKKIEFLNKKSKSSIR